MTRDGQTMTNAEAGAVYDVLVEECGATSFDETPTIRADFISGVTRHGFTEYRFMGALGFGGKFWDANGKWYVSYYPEDRTPERDAMVNRANLRLEELRLRFREGYDAGARCDNDGMAATYTTEAGRFCSKVCEDAYTLH